MQSITKTTGIDNGYHSKKFITNRSSNILNIIIRGIFKNKESKRFASLLTGDGKLKLSCLVDHVDTFQKKYRVHVYRGMLDLSTGKFVVSNYIFHDVYELHDAGWIRLRR